LAGLSIGYFLLVAGAYSSYKNNSGGLFESVAYRLNAGSAEASITALEGNLSQSPSDILSMDWNYFLTKYLGGNATGLFTFDQLVSSRIYGTPLGQGAWTVPVTVGAFPFLANAFPLGIAYVLMFLLGTLMSICLRVDRAIPSLSALAAIVSLMSWDIVSKGNIVYSIINYSLVALILMLVGALGSLAGRHLVRKDAALTFV
jgi:hypothetical protein